MIMKCLNFDRANKKETFWCSSECANAAILAAMFCSSVKIIFFLLTNLFSFRHMLVVSMCLIAKVSSEIFSHFTQTAPSAVDLLQPDHNKHPDTPTGNELPVAGLLCASVQITMTVFAHLALFRLVSPEDVREIPVLQEYFAILIPK